MYICQLVWKKINQEITVVHNTILYWQKKTKKNSRLLFKKIENYKSLPEKIFGNEKIEKKLPIRTHFIFSV